MMLSFLVIDVGEIYMGDMDRNYIGSMYIEMAVFELWLAVYPYQVVLIISNSSSSMQSP